MNTHKSAVHSGNTPGEGGKDDKVQAGADLKVAMESALSAKQMSVSALARDADVQRGDIYKWWRGEQRPSRNSLARVAAKLDVDVSVLRQALGEPVRATETTDPLVSALHRQSEAIEGLTAELAKDRADQREATVALLRAVATVVPAPQGTRADRTPATPVDTAR